MSVSGVLVVDLDRVAPRKLADHLLSTGRYVVTLPEVQKLTGLSTSGASAALTRLRQDGQVFSPTRGLYIMIEPRYRSWGVPPATDFVDPFMKALGRSYYVSLLSAAELYGASHQRPQVFQVMVDRQVADREFGRVRLRFYLNSHLAGVPTVWRNSAMGQFRVATPAAVCLDLASRPNEAGGLNNVATVLSELLAETSLQAGALADAGVVYPVATLRRLGWLLEFVESELDVGILRQSLNRRSGKGSRGTALLDPAGGRRGRIHSGWGVVENCRVEADL